MNNDTVTIPKRISGGEELVVIQRREFEEFQKWKKEIKDVLEKVARGRKEHREKRTYTVSSPRELL